MALCFVIASVTSTFAARHQTSSFDGAWKSDTYNCKGEEGAEAEKCAKEPPSFDLNIWIKDGRLCGTHSVVTWNATDSDAPKESGGVQPLRGFVRGNVAPIDWTSSWGIIGTARLTLAQGKLHWKILSRKDVKNTGAYAPEGGTLLPDSDVLSRTGAPWEPTSPCGAF
jgi:hypothetical protein